MASINPVTDLTVLDGIAELIIDSPPVNALSFMVCEGLFYGIRTAMDDQNVRAIIVSCAGRTFVAGADIAEFGQQHEGPTFFDTMALLENASKPVAAAIFGTTLGGGLELALACHYRVAARSTRLGLPEVHLGLLPGAGGTQRLPRLIGADRALNLIVFGTQIGAEEALQLGVVDRLADDDRLRSAARELLIEALGRGGPWPRVEDRHERILEDRVRSELFDEFRSRHADAFRGFRAPENILRCVEAAVSLPFRDGMAREAELFQQLVSSVESAAQRRAFFAERAASKVPDLGRDVTPRAIRGVAYIGTGETVTRAAKMAAIANIPTVSLSAADLLIVGDGADADAKTVGLASQDAIVAVVDESVDINAVAEPWRTVRLIVHPGRLVEVGRQSATLPEIVKAVLELGRRGGRVSVQVAAVPGLIVGRLLGVMEKSATRLIEAGASPDAVAGALMDYGFRRIPFALNGHSSGQYLFVEGLLEKLLDPVIKAAARLCDEAVVLRASDVDIAMILGAGWPSYRGGPLFDRAA